MAGNLTLSLRTAQSGLLVNQQLLDSIANNVANVSTEGYSRKIVEVQQRVVAGSGAGVQVGAVSRMVDEGIMRSLRSEYADQGTYSTREEYYSRLQLAFGTPEDNNSLTHTLASMIGAMEKLATSPEKLLEQNELVRQASDLALKIDEMSNLAQELRLLADQDIETAVTQANSLIENISQLNDTIVRNSSVGRDVTDLQDQRDLAIDQLSKLMDVTYFTRSDGDIIIMTKSGRSLTLVDNVASKLSHEAASSTSPTTTHSEGQIKGIYLGQELPSNDITNIITGGEIGALIELRDKTLTGLQSELDEMAARLRDTFNQVHNRGIPFPGIQATTGTRYFVDSATQTIKLDPTNASDDVVIGLFDSEGNPSATTTLNTIMTSGVYGSGIQTSHGAWTVDEVAKTIEDWVQANGAASATVAVNGNGQLDIQLNTTSLNLGFRDQQSSTDGATLEDAAIGFDKDGDGTVDETINGFSNFFGLNDFFIDERKWNRYDSDVLSSTFTSGNAASTLKFVDDTTTETITIPAGKTLSEIAAEINDNSTIVSASVIPDGDGFRLRLSHETGKNYSVIQTAGALLTNINLNTSEAGTSNAIKVRNDILNNPSKISGPVVNWDADFGGGAGRYFVSNADWTIAKNLSQEFNKALEFGKAGSIGKTTVKFAHYSTTILTNITGEAAHNQSLAKHKDTLVSSLKNKSDNIRGVNLDEEMSNMILFEQAYGASARIMTTVQRMLDELEDILK